MRRLPHLLAALEQHEPVGDLVAYERRAEGAPWVKWVQPSKCTGTTVPAPRIFAASAARSLDSVR
jgi:hypothetical protein